METSFYSQDELKKFRFKELGSNVHLSKKTSIYNASEISIGNNSRIDDFCILSGKIEIGSNVHIAAGVYLYAGNHGIEIRDFVGISSRSAVYAISDDYSGNAMTNPTIPEEYRNVIGGKVIFEKHSLVGSGCTILPNLTIGEGASVGSMSLINKSLEPWGMYWGIPCRFHKPREKKILDLEKEFLQSR